MKQPHYFKSTGQALHGDICRPPVPKRLHGYCVSRASALKEAWIWLNDCG